MANRYWVGGGGNWSSTSKWSATSGGSGGASVPTLNDDVFFDGNSGSGVVNIDQSGKRPMRNLYINNPNLTFSRYFNYAIPFTVYGNIEILSIGGHFFTNGTVEIVGDSDITIKIIPSLTTISGEQGTVFGIAGGSSSIRTVDILSDLDVYGIKLGTQSNTSSTNNILLRSNGHNVRTVYSFGFQVSAATNSFVDFSDSDIEFARAYSGSSSSQFYRFGGDASNVTVNENTRLIYSAPESHQLAATVQLQDKDYSILVDRGVSTYTTILPSAETGSYSLEDRGTAAHSLIFPNNSTVRIRDFLVRGSAGNLITIRPITDSGTNRVNFEKVGGGLVDADYLSISRTNATPGNTWYAGSNSVDLGNNTGWIFEDAPSFNPHISRRRLLV